MSFESTRMVVEFRHQSWITDQTLDSLRELRAGYCIVDMPQVRGLPSNRVVGTSKVPTCASMVRTGRNGPECQRAMPGTTRLQ